MEEVTKMHYAKKTMEAKRSHSCIYMLYYILCIVLLKKYCGNFNINLLSQHMAICFLSPILHGFAWSPITIKLQIGGKYYLISLSYLTYENTPLFFPILASIRTFLVFFFDHFLKSSQVFLLLHKFQGGEAIFCPIFFFLLSTYSLLMTLSTPMSFKNLLHC
jgi:hypothetical protein